MLALVTLAATAVVWAQHPGPVMTATQAWEDQTVEEPSVLYDAKAHLYRMWYTGGYSEHNALGYATSKDGIHWGKYSHNPVLGQGGSGVQGNVTHSNVFLYKGTLYAFYNADATTHGHKDPSIRLATSKDGKAWHDYGTVIPASLDANDNANSFAWVDGKGWHVLFDSMNRASGHWYTFLAEGPDPFHLRQTTGPLMSLSQGPGTFGAPWLVHENGVYQLFYLASNNGENFPDDVYEATSSDFHTWTPSPSPVVSRQQSWEYDQVADPSYANGLLFFDGLDNRDPVKIKSSISVARPAQS